MNTFQTYILINKDPNPYVNPIPYNTIQYTNQAVLLSQKSVKIRSIRVQLYFRCTSTRLTQVYTYKAYSGVHVKYLLRCTRTRLTHRSGRKFGVNMQITKLYPIRWVSVLAVDVWCCMAI